MDGLEMTYSMLRKSQFMNCTFLKERQMPLLFGLTGHRDKQREIYLLLFLIERQIKQMSSMVFPGNEGVINRPNL